MEELFKAFNEPDAILADDSDEKLTKYVEEGGHFQQGVDALMESYEGFPDMIRALVDWSNLFTDGNANLENAVQAVLQDNEQTIMLRLDEAMAGADDVIPTITAISASKRWSNIVSTMASRNRESTLHNLLTRETRLAEAGVSQDVLQSPRSFLNAILEQLSDTFSDNKPVSNDDLLALYKRVSAMCTYDECSTILALGLFHTLSKKADDPLMGGLYRRLGQEVQKEAVRVMTAASIVNENTARQYVIRLAILTDCVTSDVVMRKPIIDALLSILTKDRASRRRFESETKTLFDCYGRLIGDIGIKHGDGEVVESVVELDYEVQEKVVLIRTLCQVEIFEDMLTSLFSHEHRTYVDGKPDLGKRRCLCLLLSYAGVFIPEDDRFLAEKLANEDAKASLRVSMKSMFESLEAVAAVCEDLKPGCPRFKIKGKPVQTLLEGVKDPLIARGILLWAREGLHGGPDLRALLVTSPKHLAFLEAIAQYHEVLRDRVLDAIREVFMREYPGLDINQVEDLRDKFLKSMTSMVKIQMAHQIVHVFLTSWADNEKVDMAHLRRFITGLLEVISPPYATAFATSLLKLLENKRVAAAIDKDVRAANLVLNFRQHISRMGLV